MADPQRIVGQLVSGNEESGQNDGSSSSYESLSDPCPPVKRKQSSGPQDEDYIPEEVVCEYEELNVRIDFYGCSTVNDVLHSFLRIPLHIAVLEICFLLGLK
jgi:hypothetical protein